VSIDGSIGNSLHLVKTLKYSPIFPEYPTTDDAGFTYLINVQGLSEYEVKVAQWTCSGVKLCSKTIDNIRTMTHQSVTDTTNWTALEIYRRDAIESQTTNPQQGPPFHATWEYYEAAQQAYAQKCASCVGIGGKMWIFARTGKTSSNISYCNIIHY
jgi:hypothetical protein